MPGDLFPICPSSPPPMVSRDEQMEEVLSQLTKLTPDHPSIVGAWKIGKSVFLKELADRIKRLPQPTYNTVIEWDFRVDCPESDKDFLIQMCQKLSEGFQEAGPAIKPYSQYLEGLDKEDDPFPLIDLVFDELQRNNLRVLMIWDEFDRPLAEINITRSLWDHLRTLCLKDTLTVVTSTRRLLQELITNEQSTASEFWNIFQVVRLSPLTRKDIDLVFDDSKLKYLEFSKGAISELYNWSGGNPVVFFSILNDICRANKEGKITNNIVNVAAENIDNENLINILERQWGECSAAAKDCYSYLKEMNDLGKTVKEMKPRQVYKELDRKGFAYKKDNQFYASRSVNAWLLEDETRNSIPLLFGECEDYQKNIIEVLKRRLDQIQHPDPSLKSLVKKSISELTMNHNAALNHLNQIKNQALKLVWDKELEQDGVIPDSITKYWKEHDKFNSTDFLLDLDRDNWSLPSRSQQLQLLRYLTGCRQGFKAKAKYTSKDTYNLISAITNARHRVEHPEDQELNFHVTVNTLGTCVELLACLERET